MTAVSRRPMKTLLAVVVLALAVATPGAALAHHDEPPPDCLLDVPPDCEFNDIFQTCEMSVPPECKHK